MQRISKSYKREVGGGLLTDLRGIGRRGPCELRIGGAALGVRIVCATDSENHEEDGLLLASAGIEDMAVSECFRWWSEGDESVPLATRR